MKLACITAAIIAGIPLVSFLVSRIFRYVVTADEGLRLYRIIELEKRMEHMEKLMERYSRDREKIETASKKGEPVVPLTHIVSSRPYKNMSWSRSEGPLD